MRLFFRSSLIPALCVLAALCVAAESVRGQSANPLPSAPLPPPAPLLPVWETALQNFDQAIYDREVERLFVQFEASTGRRIQPGVKKKVGLKIYADSGQGLATPHALVHAVISALERRGFEAANIFLVGLNQLRLRLTGFLPSLATGETAYKGHPVFVLESGRFFDPVWFYDSPLPNRFDPVLAEKQVEGVDANSSTEQDRKSFLATPADFHRLFPGTGGALYGAASHGWMALFRRPGSISRLPGLYLAGGSVHPGPGVPMAAMSGRLAAETLLAHLDSTSRSRRVVICGGMSTPSATTAGTA